MKLQSLLAFKGRLLASELTRHWVELSETEGTLGQSKKTSTKLGSERFMTLFYNPLREAGALALIIVNVKLRGRMRRDSNLR